MVALTVDVMTEDDRSADGEGSSRRPRRRPRVWRAVVLVVVGLVSFYITYVSYRNLKNFLPKLAGPVQDGLLHNIDRAIMFGHEPAVVLHSLLGETIAAHVLAIVYLTFLPLAPLSLIVYLVWARNITWGYWYATANCLCWALGTVSYYAVPSLGPAFSFVWLYSDLDKTSVASLQDGMWGLRYDVTWNPFADSIQTVAGFASLHCAIVLTLTLVTHYTVRHHLLRVAMWTFFAMTLVSTLYFGWHFIADDIAGCAIAVFSVWLGGVATGQKFTRWGREAHPTASTSRLRRTLDGGPVDDPNGPLVASHE